MYKGFFINGNDRDRKIKYLMFFFWPFGAFIYSLRSLQSKSSRVVFFLICAAFGLCIECKNEEFDMYRITESFLSYRYMNFDELRGIIIDSINGVGVRDIYEHILYWTVNQISSNEHVFWMIASMIYAFFYLKSLSFILDDKRFKSCLMGFMIVLMFTMPQPIFTVTGLRFWTAGWLAIFCVLQIFIRNDYKYFLILLLTPFIHVTYWIYVALVPLAFVARLSEKLLIIIFFLSYPFSYLSMSFVSDAINMNILPPSLEMVALSYTGDAHLEEFNRQGTGWFWLSEMFDTILNTYYLVMAYWIVKHKNMITDKQDKYLLIFILVVYSFANFTLLVPHLGIRYLGFVQILLPLLWFRVFGLCRYKMFIYMYLICASFYLIWKRLVMHYSNVLDVDFLYDSSIVMFVDKLFY